MGVSLLLCLLPALLSTASVQAQITCLQCPPTEKACPSTGEPTPCTTSTGKEGCITVAEENTLQGTSVKGFSRGCIASYESGLEEVLTFTTGPGQYVRISAKKCKMNKCNIDDLQVPQVKESLNGLQCPSCLAVDSSTCIPAITPCKGDETYCVNFIGTFKKDAGSTETPFAALGCATPSAEFISKNLPQELGKFKIGMASTKKADSVPTLPAQPSPQSTPKPTTATTSGASPTPGKVSFTLFLPGLTGLLLVKLLS